MKVQNYFMNISISSQQNWMHSEFPRETMRKENNTMNLQTVLDLPDCMVLTGGNSQREISKVFCCDLLSIAMSKAPADGVWVTVMGNRNTLAVASLTDIACIILAEGAVLDENTLAQAEKEEIAVLSTELPIFDIALKVYEAGKP
jgi:predicted transcriptional regulator